MTTVRLARPDGGTELRTMREPRTWPRSSVPIRSRIAFAAAHVVADPRRENAPGEPSAVDWDATLSFRHHLWGHGLGVAEAMDTAQRGMGLDWANTQELVRRSAADARSLGARIAAGAGTDHVPADLRTLDDVATAYEQQMEVVEGSGSQIVLMASRQLVRVATGPEDYQKVYARVLAQAAEPVILHWLGAVFDPALAGYWGHGSAKDAAPALLDLIRDNADRIDGVKVSLLDADHERALRAALPAGVRMYTGDDFHYPDLIRGDGQHSSDALLGVFAAIAPAASGALQALDRGDVDTYDEVMACTVPLARHLFEAPTRYYKTGIAFMAWLCGLQPGLTMIGGLQGARSVPHLVQAFRLADDAGLLPDPALAASRLRSFLAVAGLLP